MLAVGSKLKLLINKRVKNHSMKIGFIKEQCSAIAFLGY